MQIQNYSSVKNTLLGFPVSVHSNADILLLDEILAVGDEAFREKCTTKIFELMEQDKTFIIISHDLEQLKQLSNRIYYMQKGIIDKVEQL